MSCQPNYRTVRNNIWGVMSCQPNYRTVRNNIWGSYELSTKLQNSKK